MAFTFRSISLTHFPLVLTVYTVLFRVFILLVWNNLPVNVLIHMNEYYHCLSHGVWMIMPILTDCVTSHFSSFCINEDILCSTSLCGPCECRVQRDCSDAKWRTCHSYTCSLDVCDAFLVAQWSHLTARRFQDDWCLSASSSVHGLPVPAWVSSGFLPSPKTCKLGELATLNCP